MVDKQDATALAEQRAADILMEQLDALGAHITYTACKAIVSKLRATSQMPDAVTRGTKHNPDTPERARETARHQNNADGYPNDIIPSASAGPQAEAVEQARLSIIAASIGSCTCNCISPNTAFHSADCRYLKLMFALDCLDPQPKSAGE